MRGKILIARILMLLYLCTVAFLCFHQFTSMPSAPKSVLGIPMDKIVHFCMFLPFSVIGAFCFGRIPAKRWRIAATSLGLLVAGCAFAAFTEIVQSRLAYRTGDKFDFLADALAMMVGSAAAYTILTRKSKPDA